MGNIAYLKDELIVDNDACETLERIRVNLELGAYNSSFNQATEPFSTDDSNWNPPPELDWYEGAIMAVGAASTKLATFNLALIEQFRKDERSSWRDYDDRQKEELKLIK